ncbi:hypothetical protein D3C77_423800 [compost metagenome]
MIMIAHQLTRRNFKMGQQLSGLSGILCSDNIRLPQNTNSTISHILQITNRCSDEIERAEVPLIARLLHKTLLNLNTHAFPSFDP